MKGGAQLDVDLAVDLRLAVGRLARRIRQADNAGRTQSQLSIMASLDRLGACRLTDLATAEGISAPTVTKIVGNLEQAGLVERSASTEDRRSSMVRLSAEGRAELYRIRHERTAFVRRRLESLPRRDVEALKAALPVLIALAGECE
jgi:DNA-binding MarR family transcriptional regulator